MKRLKCNHEFVTISNFYGDYIDRVSVGFHIYRSRQKCTKCGKERFSERLDKSCKTINDRVVQNG